jgi:uncharacterized protein
MTVPPCGGRALAVDADELIWIVDVAGQQVGDLWGGRRGGPPPLAVHQPHRDRRERLFPRIGADFTGQFGARTMTRVADTSPGQRDMRFWSAAR